MTPNSHLLGCLFTLSCCLSATINANASEPDDQTEVKLGTPGSGISLSHDFGHQINGKKVSCTLKVKNPSATAIYVKDSRVSCNCLSVEECPKAIPPGQSRSFKLLMETEGRYGRSIQTATFELKHEKYKYLRLRVSGIVDGVWVAPNTLDFGSIKRGDVKKRFVQAYQAGRDSATVTRVDSDSEGVEIKSRAPETAKKLPKTEAVMIQHIDITCSPKDTAKIGPFRSLVQIHTTDPEFPVLEVTVTGHVLGVASVRPSSVIFGAVAAGGSTVRECEIDFPCDVDLSGITFHPTNSSIICKVKETKRKPDKNQVLTLSVKLRPGKSDTPGLIKGTINGQTKDDATVVSFPFMGFIRGDLK